MNSSTAATSRTARLLALLESGPVRAALLGLASSQGGEEPAFVLSRWVGIQGRSVRSERFRSADVPHLLELLDQVEEWAAVRPLEQRTEKESVWMLRARARESAEEMPPAEEVYLRAAPIGNDPGAFRLRRSLGAEESGNWFLASDVRALRELLGRARRF